MKEIIFALKEEIGKTDLFVGRKKELEKFLRWAKKSKEELSKSIAILARRKKGKTALVQRLFNLLYTKNDPQVIPFYFTVPERPISLLAFSSLFYRTLLSQYLGFKQRRPEWIRQVLTFKQLKEYAQQDEIVWKDIETMEQIYKDEQIDESWEYARQAGHRIAGLKDERIIQIIDEFQYMNKYIYSDSLHTQHIKIASSYQKTAESKISPQIITGSYIGWLTKIIQSMVSRYREFYLESFTSEEAIEAVYNYAKIYEVPILDQTVPYLAESCYNDPYYLSEVVCSENPAKDLTTEAGIRETLKYEITPRKGNIARVWREYLNDAIDQINDRYAKQIILFLAKHGEQEIGRDRILEEIDHGLTEHQLEERLRNLIYADILAEGTTNYHYRGLGDPVFAMFFRRLYETEIKGIPLQKIEKEIEEELIDLQKRSNYERGLLGEYRLKQQIEYAVEQKAKLKDLVLNPLRGFKLGPIKSIRKDRIYLTHEKSIEADLYLRGEEEKGSDFIIEVKNWEKKVTLKVINEFIETVKQLRTKLTGNTGYILYSRKGFTDPQTKLLQKEKIMYTDAEKLKQFQL